MKKLILRFSLAIIAASMLSPILAHAQDTAFNMRFKQRNAADNADADRFVAPPAPGSSCLFYFNGDTVVPTCASIGTGLALTSGVLTSTASGVVGPAGPTGATGPQGIQGIQGIPGTNGTNGTNGTAATPFTFGQPFARTFAPSTAYQAADPTKPAITTISAACTNATTVLASSACTLQVRQASAAGLTCSTGIVTATWASTVALGLVFTQTSGAPMDVKLPIGGYFILCPTAGTFTISTAVEQTAG